MTSAPLTISLPNGEDFVFLRSARGPERLFRFRWTLAPGKKGPPPHMHPHETETFRIVSGKIRIWLDGEPRDCEPGDVAVAEPGTMHRFLNIGDEPVVVDVTIDGTLQEDTMVGLAHHLGGRAPGVGAMVRQIVGAVHTGAIDARGVVAAMLRGVVRVLTAVGVRGFQAPPNWDA
jgi:mannose-6-phosphate isomerase-like protein (cupin superfamily)